MFNSTRLLRRFTFVLALISATPAITGCATDRQVIQQAEGYHGDLQAAVITDPELVKYMQDVGQRIIAAARELHEERYGPERHWDEDTEWMFSPNMKFHLVNSDVLNAFTTGGEHMYIYTGLLNQCDTEDELAAVMAHEYAHVYGRHVHKGMERQIGTLVGGAVLGGAAGYAIGGKEHGAEYAAAGAGLGVAAGQFIGMGFTRKDEAEADELGFAFYVRAGWHPDRFDDFFQKLIDQGYDTTPEFMSDHPSLASRVETAKRMTKALPPEAASWRKQPVAGPKRLASLKQRAVQVAQSMPQDDTLVAAKLLFAAVGNCIVPIDQEEQKAARARLAEIQQQQQRQQTRR